MKEIDYTDAIFTRFLNGDGDALRELLSLYGAKLVLFINRYVNNLSVAEELMEDTFCEIVLEPKRFRREATVKTYLFTIARNKAIDYVRREKKHSSLPIDEAENMLADELHLEDRVIKDEQKRELLSAMKAIPEEYSSVLHLLYFEELSYAEIGLIMKKTVKQIGNLAHRARLSLKGELERRGFVYEDL